VTETWPVELKLVATIFDPETGQPLETINLELDKRGYSALFYDSGTGRWRATERGARRV
jgi:hypothetical protein